MTDQVYFFDGSRLTIREFGRWFRMNCVECLRYGVSTEVEYLSRGWGTRWLGSPIRAITKVVGWIVAVLLSFSVLMKAYGLLDPASFVIVFLASLCAGCAISGVSFVKHYSPERLCSFHLWLNSHERLGNKWEERGWEEYAAGIPKSVKGTFPSQEMMGVMMLVRR